MLFSFHFKNISCQLCVPAHKQARLILQRVHIFQRKCFCIYLKRPAISGKVTFLVTLVTCDFSHISVFSSPLWTLCFPGCIWPAFSPLVTVFLAEITFSWIGQLVHAVPPLFLWHSLFCVYLVHFHLGLSGPHQLHVLWSIVHVLESNEAAVWVSRI